MSFGEALLDKFLVWMGRIKREDVFFHKPELFQQLDKSNKGAVIVVSHLGNTEICSALAHQLPDTRLTILVHTRHAQKFNVLMNRFNSSNRIELLQVTDVDPAMAMMLSERIEAGELIVIAGDRTPVTSGTRTAEVDFLGRKAHMPQGAFILASLLKCPVYLMFCLKQGKQYHIYLELFAERIKFDRKQRKQAIHQTVQNYASRLEYYCLIAPLQWFNFFPFWGRGTDELKDASSSTVEKS
jgi:predicted LPLAT superfamily acyltransferase